MRSWTARCLIVPVAAVLVLLQFPRLAAAQEPAVNPPQTSRLPGEIEASPFSGTAPGCEMVSPSPCVDCAECFRSWTFRVIPYGWIPGMHGDVTLHNVTAPVDVSIGRVFDIFTHNLNAAAIGQVEASNGTFGFIFNGIYADVGVGKQVNRLNFTSGLSMTILDATLTYQVNCVPELLGLPCGSQFVFLAGARYYSLAADLTVTGPNGRSATGSGATDWVDPIFGGRLRVPLFRCLTAQVRGDIGGFSIGSASQFTWNVEATLEYQMTRHISLMAGYRWLSIERDNQGQNQDFGSNLTLSGPMVGLAIDF